MSRRQPEIVFVATSRADLIAAEISARTRRHWGSRIWSIGPADPVIQLRQVLTIVLSAPGVTDVIAKVEARLQGRCPPGCWSRATVLYLVAQGLASPDRR